MRRNAAFVGWLVVLFLMLCSPLTALGNGLTIVDVDVPKEGDPAEKAPMTVYFDLRKGDGMAMTGIQADNCKVLIDGKSPEVVKAEIKEFQQGDRGVAVLFIFPVAKNYSEESFAIRATLSTLIQRFNRPIDMLNAVTYDQNAMSIGWSKASEATFQRAISEIQTTENLEPNLFGAFNPALAMLENLQNVSQKYLVIISDAEGAIVGDKERALRLVGNLTEQLKKHDIKPIVIAYSPDGDAGLSNIDLIKRIATNTNGAFFKADDIGKFQQVIQRDVYDFIFKQYIYEVQLNMSGDNWVDPGKYPMQLVVTTTVGEEKAAVKVAWPKLSKSRTALWITLGIVGFLLLCAVGFIIYRRNAYIEDDEIEEAPQEIACATCGKLIPKQLFGFNGEFCLSGGLPDCPYYQMPDRGKIQITRGVMADTTFFIKKDMTTIGSNPDNDIYLADPSVSRKHAAIKTDEGKRYEIRDFGSANGLYINNDKIERKFLRDGDLLRFGKIETVFKLK